MDTIFNTDGCFYRALDDEPIFVLLARDPCFAETIRGWETSRQALIGRGEKPQGDHPMLLEALATATAGVAWRNESTDPTNGYDAGQHARWHVEAAPPRRLVEVVGRSHRKGVPAGGHMLPYDDWLTVLQTAMCLGNRFLLWEFDRELVFNENMNYLHPEGTPDWSGYYPVQNSLQKDMLWQALRDHKAATRHKVDTVRRLIEAPTYANILRRANELGTEGCPSELLTKYLLTFDDNVPVTFYAGDIRKALEALRRERDLAGRPETVTATSGAGEIDPAKEALWIDMAEERGFLSAEDAEKARAALPAGTKAAIPGKHLIFIVQDLARKIAMGLRQVTTDIGGSLEAHKNHGDDYCGHHSDLERWTDRINGYAAELEAGEAQAARFRSRPIRMHPALGAPYEPQEEPLGNPYKRFAETYAHEEMTVEDAQTIVERFRKRFPEMKWPGNELAEDVPPGVYYGIEGGNFYDAATNAGQGNEFYAKWRSRSAEFPQKVHDEVAIPAGYPHAWTVEEQTQGRWRGGKINPAQYAKGGTVKAESDTLDVTDTPDLPPHRFTMFTKARGWAYGRGLEINPAHIPDMLDRMETDGWHLQAVFGGVEPTKVGMLFKRVEMVTVDMEYYWRPTYPPSVAEMMAAPTEGVDDERTSRANGHFLGTYHGWGFFMEALTPEKVRQQAKAALETTFSYGRGQEP